MAAGTGKMFGSIMNNPFIVGCIVALLIYLAGSMIGFYDMYIPRFLQPKQNTPQKGSLISIFLFGAASGTIASPCLSPGLLLLLTIVTSIGSSLLGFALLFSFGFGLGIPLLVIGTFSSSLNMLPQAGSWMVDIKQFFGFIILATCFYFISIFVPFHILSWVIAFFIAFVGLFYLVTASASQKMARVVKNCLGIMCIAASVYAFFYAYKITDIYQHASCEESNWLYDVQEALEKAKKCSKLLLIDISAPYCSICKAIDKKLFAHPTIQSFLPSLIALKINDIDSNKDTQKLGITFKIVGAPTVILYDPTTEKELQRWGAELYEYNPEQFIADIGKYLINN
jgi:thiol:disulfide interchange protein DsbD